MGAVTTSGVVVMNLLPSHASIGDTRISLHCVPLLSGIEQSLSMRTTEAENIYENPDSVRQVMNQDAPK